MQKKGRDTEKETERKRMKSRKREKGGGIVLFSLNEVSDLSNELSCCCFCFYVIFSLLFCWVDFSSSIVFSFDYFFFTLIWQP